MTHPGAGGRTAGSKAGPGGPDPRCAGCRPPQPAEPFSRCREPPAGRTRGGARPGSFSPQVAPSRPPPGAPGRARPQGRTLAPQPPLLESEDADLGEDVHQVAIAEPAVLVGAVPPPAGRGPVPVLLPRLPLLADQAAGDGRCHGCSPARPRRAGRREAARRSAPAGTHSRGRGRAGASSGPRRGCGGAPAPCGRRELPPPRVTAWVPAVLPAVSRRTDTCSGGSAGGLAERRGEGERDSGHSRARSAPVGSGRSGRVGSARQRRLPGLPSAPSRRRPLARRCHRHGRGGYRRLFPAPA